MFRFNKERGLELVIVIMRNGRGEAAVDEQRGGRVDISADLCLIDKQVPLQASYRRWVRAIRCGVRSLAQISNHISTLLFRGRCVRPYLIPFVQFSLFHVHCSYTLPFTTTANQYP